MIKSLFLIVTFMCVSFVSFSQRDSDDANESFFKKENVFTVGTLNVAFGNQQTSLGLSPFFGYSINKYLDVAAVLSFNYTSLRDYPYLGDKLRQKIYGPGAFIRVFPFNFVFAQAQYEFNLQRNKYIPYGGTGSAIEKFNFDSHSFLVGGGISNGKDFPSQKSYYYISILWDVANSPASPYKDNLNRSVPIIRAGYNIALFQGGR
jgi:hypothetical protein